MTVQPSSDQATLLTAEEYFYEQPTGPSELLAGTIVARSPAGGRHGSIAAHINARLWMFVQERRVGSVFVAKAGFVVRRGPDTVRAPDVSFVRTERLPRGGVPEGFFPGPPDLAIEVVSPSDRWSEVDAKVFEYLAAGSQEVWVVDPPNQKIHVYRTGNLASVYTIDQTLTTDVLPGFELPLRSLFEQA